MLGSQHQLLHCAVVLLPPSTVQEHGGDGMHVNVGRKVVLWAEKALAFPGFWKFIGHREVRPET